MEYEDDIKAILKCNWVCLHCTIAVYHVYLIIQRYKSFSDSKVFCICFMFISILCFFPYALYRLIDLNKIL